MCLFIGFGICSCNDYLDVVPDQTPTLDNAFSDRYMAERFLATCYYNLPSAVSYDRTPGFLGSLEMVLNNEHRTNTGMVVGLGQNDRSTALMDNWSSGYPAAGGLYAGIRDCNTFLDNIEKVPDLPRDEKDRWIAEVTLIKAYIHFFLITQYGPMCIVRESAPITTSTQGVRVYRDKVDDCFAYVLELLEKVIQDDALPAILTSASTESGRFAKAAAYAIKAKVLVYWASPLFNGNTEYSGFLNHNKEPFFNQTPDPSRWTKAVEACKAAVVACSTSNIRLTQLKDYVVTLPVSDTTAQIMMLRQSVSKRDHNVETIWSNSNTDLTFEGWCMPGLDGTNTFRPTRGYMSVPLSTVDVFYTANGVPINEDDSYDYDGRFNLRTGDFGNRYYIRRNEQTAAMNFDREPRFYSTLGFDRGNWYGNHWDNPPASGGAPLPDDQCLYVKGRSGESANRPDPGEYNATGYWPKKLVGPNSRYLTGDTWITDRYPFPNMRYADLLLLTAEAVNEAEGPTNAYPYIDEVRTRAGLDGVVNSWQTHAKANYKSKPTTKEGLRAIIQQERKIELACEGHYFWDSRRWKTAATEQNRPIQGWNVLKNPISDYYTPITIYTQRFTTPRDYFFPIPESEFINNPQLIQNPGW
ncbi:starch-binding protein [Bacteroidia bacterium]|nr:starch-binding protein [Bacteroidia bacterium]